MLITEGTYPYVMGGVSTWCDMLLTGLPHIDWHVYAMTAGPEHRPSLFVLPPNAQLAGHVRLWGSGHDFGSTGTPERTSRLRVRRSLRLGRGANRRVDLAATLVEGLLGWEGDVGAVVDALVWCRLHPQSVLPVFRDSRTWDLYLAALNRVLHEEHPEVGHLPDLDLNSAINLYRTMSWVARTGAAPTPENDLSLVTAAGWAGLPAVVDRALRGTPILLAEHGLYVRESYLASVRSSDPLEQRFIGTRLARGLTRVAYRFADVVAPVAEANRAWEEALGVSPQRIRTIPNGVPTPADAAPPPGNLTVVSVGRVDPLKDIGTMLRVAQAVRRRVPGATFLHYGPFQVEQAAYTRACMRLHEELELGDSFRFMGPTSDPTGVMRDADVVLMTSISEGFPMTVLEALSQARPVVTTLVGGVLDAMQGAGLTAPPGDVYGLAAAVTTLLEEPELAAALGRRGHARVSRRFSQQRCLDAYSALIDQLADPDPAKQATA